MPTILGANSVRDTGYNVDNSIRLDGTDDHFSRTLSQAGTSNKAFTFSCWIKRSKRNTDVPRLIHMGGSGASPNYYISVRFRDDQNGRLSFYTEANGGGFQLNTNALFRDTTGWMHVVVAVNSAATEEIDRQKMYVNGVQITSFSSTTAMSYNENLGFNDSSDVIYLFRKQQDTDHFPGYAAEVALIDGQQLTPTSFGEFDEDSPTIWKPIDFKNDVTFGTNGFYLEFKDSSNLGADTSGNGNDLNTSLAGATSQSTDTCTNNFCTLNDLANYFSSHTFSEGNLKVVTSSSTARYSVSNFAVSSGKWYWEAKLSAISDGGNSAIGIESDYRDTPFGNSSGGFAYFIDGRKINNSSYTSYGNSYTTGDIIGVAVDMDNRYIYFSKNGTFQNSGDPTSGSSGTGAAFNFASADQYFMALGGTGTTPTSTWETNFGSPAFSISSGNADANGHGSFEYAVPSGYFALCTKNLAEFG